MMSKLLSIGVLAAVLAGCASERVVLFPSSDGRPSGVVVRNAKGAETLLDKPYAGVATGLTGDTQFQSNPAEVAATFGKALSALPIAPKSFLLYFESGSNTLTPASQAEFAKVREEIAQRPAAEAMVIGHTDRVGKLEANDKLSLRRAEMIREQLIDAGVAAAKLEAVGRGEREPLIPTADEVDEPRNRRVEINVR